MTNLFHCTFPYSLGKVEQLHPSLSEKKWCVRGSLQISTEFSFIHLQQWKSKPLRPECGALRFVGEAWILTAFWGVNFLDRALKLGVPSSR